MPAAVATIFTVSGLSKATANALRKKAERRGEYIKDLIAEDVELDRMARTRSFAQLAMPFQKALAGLSESDLDALARPPRGKSKR